MTAAIRLASMFFSAACWRMMSSWRSGSVNSRIARSNSPVLTIRPTTNPTSTAAATPAVQRRRRTLRSGDFAPGFDLSAVPDGLKRRAANCGDLSAPPSSFHLIAQLREQLGQLPLEVIDRSIVADHVLCPCRLLLLGELPGAALLDQGMTALLGTGPASLFVADDRNRRIEGFLHPGLEEQRHLHDSERGSVRQRSPPFIQTLPDSGVEL